MEAKRMGRMWAFIAVAALAAGTALGQEGDLVTNPSFEKRISETDEGVGKMPVEWIRSTLSQEDKSNVPDSKSVLVKVAGGKTGDFAGKLVLDAGDKWMYAQTNIRPTEVLEAGDKFTCSVAVKAAQAARGDLYLEAWNSKENKGCTVRKRFEAGAEWTTAEATLAITDAATGLAGFRVVVQLYTPSVELLIDDVKVERAEGGG
ncbi:MAG: hypothetical protein V2A58_16190 [Planctomycetota bacterium]